MDIVKKFIIDKPMQKIFSGKATRIKVVLMLIDSPYKVIGNPDINSRPGIRHNVHSKILIPHAVIISERFPTSGNDIHTKASRADKIGI
jgi:hypothetical protein